MTPTILARVFRVCAPGRVDVPEDDAELEVLLQRALEEGQGRWPQLALHANVFLRHLALQLPPASAECTLAQVIERLHLADLYLACACVHQVPEALPLLEHDVLQRLPAMLRESADVVNEVCQKVRVHLLVGPPQDGPKLATYRGRGSLVNWVYAIADNMVPRQATPTPPRPEQEIAAALEAIPAPGPDVDLALIKHRYGHEFRETLREVLTTIPNEQRRLLRYYYVDKLNTTELGRLMGISQSTASRRLDSAYEAIFDEVRRLLQERFQLSSQEFNSLLEVIRSQLDVSFSVLLNE